MTTPEITEIKMVDVSRICPDSTVNVRRSEVEENADLLFQSITKNGYRPEHPVLLRPYPEESAQYDYEAVSGQSRLKGAVKAGMTAVPCVIEEMDNEEAIKRSFSENIHRGDLTVTDQIYWYTKKFEEARDRTLDRRQSLKATADFFNVSPQTVENKLEMAMLPAQVTRDIDQKLLTEGCGEGHRQKVRGAARR